MADLTRNEGAYRVAVPINLETAYAQGEFTVLEAALTVVEKTKVASFLAQVGTGTPTELSEGVGSNAGGTEAPPTWVYRAADYAVPGRDTRFKLVSNYATNAVAPAAKLEPLIYTVSSVAGAEKLVAYTVAAVAASGAIREPAKESLVRSESGLFSLVDGATYAIGLQNPKETAAKSQTEINIRLIVVRV